MNLRRWSRISSEQVLANPWWRYRRDVFEIEPGRRGEYHCVSTHGSALVVPVTAAGQWVLVEQYRYLGDRSSIEFPCGGLRADEVPEVAAARELAEEAGVAGPLRRLGSFNPWNGVTDEQCHVFLAKPVEPLAAPPRADETEAFKVHKLWPAELRAAIANGTVWDGMTLAAVALFAAIMDIESGPRG
jgi:ADP-ribose pyrophosphatase